MITRTADTHVHQTSMQMQWQALVILCTALGRASSSKCMVPCSSRVDVCTSSAGEYDNYPVYKLMLSAGKQNMHANFELAIAYICAVTAIDHHMERA